MISPESNFRQFSAADTQQTNPNDAFFSLWEGDTIGPVWSSSV